eukprot:3255326-Prymnesium_polylepis.2
MHTRHLSAPSLGETVCAARRARRVPGRSGGALIVREVQLEATSVGGAVGSGGRRSGADVDAVIDEESRPHPPDECARTRSWYDVLGARPVTSARGRRSAERKAAGSAAVGSLCSTSYESMAKPLSNGA